MSVKCPWLSTVPPGSANTAPGSSGVYDEVRHGRLRAFGQPLPQRGSVTTAQTVARGQRAEQFGDSLLVERALTVGIMNGNGDIAEVVPLLDEVGDGSLERHDW